MFSPRRSWVWILKDASRRRFCPTNFNSVIFIFLMTATLMLLIARNSPVLNTNKETLSSYPLQRQRVKFLISDRKMENGGNSQTENTLEDKIFSVFNREMTPQSNLNEHDKGAEGDKRAGAPEMEKNAVKETKGFGLNHAKDEITKSEENFDLDEEFHPPTNSKKIYKTVGSLLQTFVGSLKALNGVSVGLSKGLEEAENSGFLKPPKMDSPISNLFSTLNKLTSFQISSSKSENFKERQDSQKKLGVVRNEKKKDYPGSSSGLERKSSALSSNNSNDLSLTSRSKTWNLKSSQSPPLPHLWIQDALKEPNRNQSAQEIQNIYAIIARRKTWTRERSRCRNILPIGGKPKKDQFDPDKTQLVCQDSDFEATFGKGCIVYSFGIHDNWNFENSVAKRGCKVMAFDASIKEMPQGISPNIRFTNVGLGPKDEVKIIKEEKVQFYTLQTLVDKLKHSKSVISYLKMNVNGEEWPILEQMVNKSPTISNNILQLGLTTHLHTALIDHSLYGAYAKVLKHLESLGFQMFASKEVAKRREFYSEPVLENRTVSLTNYLTFIKV